MTIRRDVRSVPIPRRMRELHVDERGYPAPYVVLVDADGTPQYTINDTRKTLLCVAQRRCAICGIWLGRGMWFVGGPLSALSPEGWYIDTPLHHECMTYALQVCPYLAAPKYAGRIDLAKTDASKLPGHKMFLDHTMIPERPPLFVCVMSTHMEVRRAPATLYVRPRRNTIIAWQYWREGERLPQDVGRAEALAAMQSWEVSGGKG